MFRGENWFAWFPVMTQGGRPAWLETVYRERSETAKGATPWRYYTLN